MAKFCTSCGMKLADDAVFCKNCGKKQVNFQDVSKFKTVKTNTTSQSDAIKEKLIDKTPKVMNCGAVTKKINGEKQLKCKDNSVCYYCFSRCFWGDLSIFWR